MTDVLRLLDEVEMLAEHQGVLPRLNEIRQAWVEVQAEVRIKRSEVAELEDLCRTTMLELEHIRELVA